MKPTVLNRCIIFGLAMTAWPLWGLWFVLFSAKAIDEFVSSHELSVGA